MYLFPRGVSGIGPCNQIHTHLAPDLGCYWNGMEKPSDFLELGVVLLALFT